MKTFIEHIEDYYVLTKAGYIGLVIAMIIVIAVAAVIVIKKQDAGNITAKKLTYAGIALALAFVTSYIKLEMPMGGSVTLFSMFFICYIAYAYGASVGLLVSLAYSVLQFIQSGGSYFLTPFQVCCDYFFAFTALGIAGFWYKKKHGLVIGYCVAVAVRWIFHTIGGYMYWMSYMPEDFPKKLTSVYSPIYNATYILPELIATLIIINIPAVKKAINSVTERAQA